ncbi:FHA domain-containing protein FHA2-like isoform X2 [Andrographis paniculata]|uniref:FHA domain-containing protein FHA2-like isoform X2 n=1 Tax=Andrographis paniculata TaxID=175694 RepID=UPI0021E8A63A|nr:FHA domain-containing protein FHA2-like isoform X2 [Andrographis paniculata]
MASSDVEAGFAKLQGEDFEYYMQTYSIILGRNSKKSTVDVDLASLGGGMNISRHHARIFYDFQRRRFALEVLGKNGCSVEGVLHLPGNPPVKLDSQDLLQIGDKEFYFLLPIRSILGGLIGPRHHVSNYQIGPAHHFRAIQNQHRHHHHHHHLGLPPPPAAGGVNYGKKGRVRAEYYEEEEEGGVEDGLSGGKRVRMVEGVASGHLGDDKEGNGRPNVDRDADNQQLLSLEEKEVVSTVATVLSDLCGPGEWMPMDKLHSEMVEQFGNVWHHSRVRRYLTCEQEEEYPAAGSEAAAAAAKEKPWLGLMMLVRKYPEHFVINTRSKGRHTQEFVSLVSLLS